jgi:hypothetical protein
VRELAVVREQERARSCRVEAADRDDARLVLDELDDRGPPVRIARGRDDSRRLVQEDVRERLRDEEPSVEVDHVALLDKRVQPRIHAVDAHRPVLISSSAPRREAIPVRAR